MTFASGLAIISGIRVLATEILLERMVDAAVLIKKNKITIDFEPDGAACHERKLFS